MEPSKILGYAAISVGQTLEPFAYNPAELGDNDVRVGITHCGVCHTDIQAIDDYYGITTFPFVPGHEIVGNITETGSAVTELQIGDRVGIGWQGRSCGTCEWCLKGQTQLCMAIEDTTVMVPYGGFSTSVIADHLFTYPIPPAMPSETAAVLMCAGLTVYSAFNAHLTSPGHNVGIFGIGGLGHLAIQFAHALGCDVTAISSSPDKQEQAFGFGADHFINTADNTRYGRTHQYSFDQLYFTANHVENWSPILSMLKKRGQLVLLGFPDLEFNSTDLVAHELSITGSLIGNPPVMRDMLVFAEKHHITPLIELIPMSQVNEALQRVKENKARYRIVLVNDLLG